MLTSAPAGATAYGAFELKHVQQRHMMWALGLAGALHAILVGVWWMTEHFGAEAPPTQTVRVMKYSELGPPPSISTANAPAAIAVELPKTLVKPKIAVPVPVPDEVAPQQTIPTQEEMATPVDTGIGDGSGTAIEADVAVGNIEADAPPPDFVPFEKEPTVVRRVEPQYPEAAKSSGLEGAVFAKLWIDKEGKVKEVVILKTPSPVFESAVIEAAKQWLFTPAVMNSGPVAVWFPVKFTFTLEG